MKSAASIVLMLVGFAIAPLRAMAQDAPVPQPSFDCGKAKSVLEKSLCSEVNLAKLDAEMANVYLDLMAAMPEADQARIKAAQRDWNKGRATTCKLPAKGDASAEQMVCLRRIYRERVTSLTQTTLALTDPVSWLGGLWRVATKDPAPYGGSLLRLSAAAVPSLTGGTCTNPTLSVDGAGTADAQVTLLCLGQTIAVAKPDLKTGALVWTEGKTEFHLTRVGS